MTQLKILIADDDKRIRTMIREYLSLENYVVEEAQNGKEAIRLLQNEHFDLLVLDIMMPEMDGWDVCKAIRDKHNIPIIMLSARSEEYDKLLGFELGIDDYITKPFSPKELSARMKAVLKRVKATDSQIDRFIYNSLEVDFASQQVVVGGKTVSLTKKEFELLRYFIQNKNIVLTRDQLLSEVWGFDYFGDHRTVDTHIKTLRERLGKYRSLIKTVWGTGYKFELGGSS